MNSQSDVLGAEVGELWSAARFRVPFLAGMIICQHKAQANKGGQACLVPSFMCQWDI